MYLTYEGFLNSACTQKRYSITFEGECLDEVEEGNRSAASFMASVEECISERECKL